MKFDENSGLAAIKANLPLILAVVALLVSLGNCLSGESDLVVSLDKRMNGTVLPQIEKINYNAEIAALYDLKRALLTLEQVGMTSSDSATSDRISEINTQVRELLDVLGDEPAPRAPTENE